MAVADLTYATADRPPAPDGPVAASARRYLREALPPLYRDRTVTIEEPPVERWLAALEEVLDPVVLQLDNLAAHLDPELAERDWIDTLTRWLGMRVADDLELEARRARVRAAAELSQVRGTLKGLKREIDITFPGAGITVDHSATVTTGSDPTGRRAAPAPHLSVTVPAAFPQSRRRALQRVVEDHCPAHVPWSFA